jgi:hypothetical protein
MRLLPDKARILSPLGSTPDTAGATFRIGVATDGSRPPRWVVSCIAFLQELPGIAVHVLPLATSGASRRSWPSWLTRAVYSRSRRAFDPFGEVEARWSGTAESGPDSLEEAAGLGLDIVVWLASSGESRPDLARLARHGALSVRLGRAQRAIPFWDEVSTEEPTSTVTIYWHDTSLDRGRAVRRAETGTIQGIDVTTTAEEPLVAVIQMLAELCLGFARGGGAWEQRLRLVPEQPVDWPGNAAYPGALEAGGFVARKMLRSALLRASSRGRMAKWSVGIRRNTGHSIVDPGRLGGFVNIPVPSGSLEMADPFLLDHGGRTWMLFEDVPLGGRRGRLACMEVSERGACSDMVLLMDRDDHLSYPCAVPYKGDVFLVPEHAEAGLVNLYRFATFPSRLELESTLFDGFPVVDTTPVLVGDRWYFFSTTAQPFMETLLFCSPGLDKPWTRHPASPVSRSVRSCRSAGHLFWKDGRLFRPTQDCSVRYGYAITVNEITRLTATEFEEHEVGRVLPTWAPGLLGTHTWNETGRLQVIDGLHF